MNDHDSNPDQEQPEALSDLELRPEQGEETKAGIELRRGVDQDKTLWNWRHS